MPINCVTTQPPSAFTSVTATLPRVQSECSTQQPTRRSAKTSSSEPIRSPFSLKKRARGFLLTSPRSARLLSSIGTLAKSRNGSFRALAQISRWRSMRRIDGCSLQRANRHVCSCLIWIPEKKLPVCLVQSTQTTCHTTPTVSGFTSQVERASFLYISRSIRIAMRGSQKFPRQLARVPAHILDKWENTTAFIWLFPHEPIGVLKSGCTKPAIEQADDSLDQNSWAFSQETTFVNLPFVPAPRGVEHETPEHRFLNLACDHYYHGWLRNGCDPARVQRNRSAICG